MPSARRPLALILLTAALAAPPLSAQDEPTPNDTSARVERFREFLDRAPFHDAAFDGLVSAVGRGAPLARFAIDLERELADHDSAATRVLLARLLRRQGRPRAALDVLDLLDPAGLDLAGLSVLRARCHAAAGAPTEALAALDRAAAATSERELARDIHALRALTLVELGRDADAAAALDELARFTSPTSLARAEIAERAEILGLDEAAIAHWNTALELAGDEPADRVRALRGIARLHTARGELELALEAWVRTEALLAHDHWMRPELDAALLELHAERGTLEAWIAALESDLADEPADRARRATLVRALDAVGRQADARAALRVGTQLAPRDLARGRARGDALVATGEHDAALREARRALLTRRGAPLRPDERELHLALAAVLARDGDLDAARRELEILHTRDPADVTSVNRAIELWLELRAPRSATVWLRRAAELEPDVLATLTALARHEHRLGLHDDARATAERASELAMGSASRLAELADLQLELGQLDAAARSLEVALELEPGAVHLLTRLAELRQRAGDVEGALDALGELCRRAAPGGARERAAERFAELAVRNERHARHLELAVDRAAQGEADAATYLVIAAIERQLGRPERAVAALRLASERLPGDVPLRRELAATLEHTGDRRGAIAVLEALRADAPRERARLALELARLHGSDQPRERAALLREARRDAPGDLGVQLEVARLAEASDERTLAKEALERATQLAPDDAALRLRLGRMLSADFEHELARPELVLAHRLGGAEVREQALRELYDILLFDEELEPELERLRARASRAAPDLDAAELFVALLVLDLEHDEALAVLDRLVARRPREPRFYELRARIASDLGRDAQALSDYEVMRRLGGELDADLTLRMLELALRADDLERTRSLARELDDPLRASQVLSEHGQRAEAVALLDEARALGGLGPDGFWRLAELCRELGDVERAVDALEEYELAAGPSVRGLLELGAIHLQAGERRALGRVLQALHDRFRESGRVLAWLREAELEDEWFGLGCLDLRARPTDEARLRALSRQALGEPRYAQRLLELVSAWLDGSPGDLRVPRRHEPDTWRRALLEVELALLRALPARADGRRAELARRLASGAALDEREWVHWFQLELDDFPFDASERSTVEVALATQPDSDLVLAAAATRCARAGEHARAAELWLALAARSREPGLAASMARERELALADWQAELDARLGHAFQRALDQEARDELTRATFRWDALAPGGVRALPAPEEIAREAAAALAQLGRDDEARAQLDALEELAPGAVFHADALLAAGAHVRAAAVLRDVKRLERSNDAVYAEEMAIVWKSLWWRCVQAGHPRRAYQLTRFGRFEQWPINQPAEMLSEVRRAFEDDLAQAEAEHAAGPTAATREVFMLRALELIEFELDEMAPERAVRACARALAQLPDATPLLRLAARLAERAGNVEGAIHYHSALAAEATAAEREELARPQTWPGRTIQLAADRREIERRLARWRSSTRFDSWVKLETAASRLDARNPLPHWLALVRLHLQRDDVPAAVRALEQVAAGDPPDPESWADHFAAVFQDIELGEEELTVQRAIYEIEPRDFFRLRDLVNTLLEADELEAARAVVERYDPAWAGDRKYPRQWSESTRRQLGIEEDRK